MLQGQVRIHTESQRHGGTYRTTLYWTVSLTGGVPSDITRRNPLDAYPPPQQFSTQKKDEREESQIIVTYNSTKRILDGFRIFLGILYGLKYFGGVPWVGGWDLGARKNDATRSSHPHPPGSIFMP